MKKEKQSWTDYVPHSVSLYYVDYRENLDSHDDLQEQCIRRNSLGPLEEQILEWYADQEHDNLQGYLSEIRNEMEADGKSAEYIRHEEKIKDLLYEPYRCGSDPRGAIPKGDITNGSIGQQTVTDYQDIVMSRSLGE